MLPDPDTRLRQRVGRNNAFPNVEQEPRSTSATMFDAYVPSGAASENSRSYSETNLSLFAPGLYKMLKEFALDHDDPISQLRIPQLPF